MGWLEISQEILIEVVTGLGSAFKTRDVSENPRMLKAYADLLHHTHYHAFVGRALSEFHVYLGILAVPEEYSQKRGMHWKKTCLLDERLTEDLYNNTSQLPIERPIQQKARNVINYDPDIGPQFAGDNLLARKMRKHQSWYRVNVLNLPYGTGPGPNDNSYYGNMLTHADGEAGRNFLTRQIFEVVQERLAQRGGAVEKYRLLHNMLSSQPMCFNLFGPLVKDHCLAKTLVEALVPEKISQVTRLEVEWSPEPAINYLNDHTAFDAFIEYQSVDGKMFGLGIETKLSEPFSQKEYDRPEYRRWMSQPNSPWLPDGWNKVQAIGHNQLWREHLLAVAMRSQLQSPYAQVRLMLVHHPEDYECARNYLNYKSLLRDGDDSLLSLSLDQIIKCWLSVVLNEDQKHWLLSFKKRYIDLD